MCLVAQLCPTLWDPMDCSPPGPSIHGNSLGKNTGVGYHTLLQGIFPTQWPNSGPLAQLIARSIYWRGWWWRKVQHWLQEAKRGSGRQTSDPPLLCLSFRDFFFKENKRLGLITVFDVSVTFFNHSFRSQDVSSLQFSTMGVRGRGVYALEKQPEFVC